MEGRARSGPCAIGTRAHALCRKDNPRSVAGDEAQLRLRLDDLVSTPDKPGFQILVEDAPFEIAAGAIGKVWRPVIPFVHVPDAAAFVAFSQEGHIKVAWALRVVPEGEQTSRVEFELRVVATTPGKDSPATFD